MDGGLIETFLYLTKGKTSEVASPAVISNGSPMNGMPTVDNNVVYLQESKQKNAVPKHQTSNTGEPHQTSNTGERGWQREWDKRQKTAEVASPAGISEGSRMKPATDPEVDHDVVYLQKLKQQSAFPKYHTSNIGEPGWMSHTSNSGEPGWARQYIQIQDRRQKMMRFRAQDRRQKMMRIRANDNI